MDGKGISSMDRNQPDEHNKLIEELRNYLQGTGKTTRG